MSCSPQGFAGKLPTFAAFPSAGPASPPLYGFPLKFACLLPSRSPKDVAVVVPARQAYSHWASVGRRNSQSSGNSPDSRPSPVSFWQSSSASAQFTLPNGSSSPAGNSTVNSPGNSPITRFQSSCVVSYFAIQKPLVSVTSTWSSSGRRSGSLRGLPIVNVPTGHQQSLIPASS